MPMNLPYRTLLETQIIQKTAQDEPAYVPSEGVLDKLTEFLRLLAQLEFFGLFIVWHRK
jgi:hypothetical protein